MSTFRICAEPINGKSIPDYVVRPATLDAVLHNIYFGLSKGLTEEIHTSVPSTAERVWASKTGLNSSSGAEFKVFTEGSHISPAHSKNLLVAMTPEKDRVLIVVDD